MKKPRTVFWQPQSRWTGCVYGYLSRDTVGCGLSLKDSENRFPATPFISLHWFLQGQVELISRGSHTVSEILPRHLVCGQQMSPAISRNLGDVRVFSIGMYPDAFSFVFGISPLEIRDRFLDAQDILPEHAWTLVDAIEKANSDEERTKIFETFLEQNGIGFKTSLWTNILRVGARVSTGLVAMCLGVGNRQSLRTVKQKLGVGVGDLKKYERGERAFELLTEKIKARQNISIIDIAQEAGYSDQSHLSRACKESTGRTPGQLLRDIQNEESDWVYLTHPTALQPKRTL